MNAYDELYEAAEVGYRLGVYELQENIGHGYGSMSKMFTAIRADGSQPEQKVAIKICLPRAAFLFSDEMRIMKLLDHPAMPKFIESLADEQAFAMTLLPGVSLRQLYSRFYLASNSQGLMDVPEILELCRQIASGLAYLAGQGIVHRDLCPYNILHDHSASFLVDFGLAESVGNQDPKGRGHEGYIAPEVHNGVISPKSDVYSLGVVIAELLAGVSLNVEDDSHQWLPEKIKRMGRASNVVALVTAMLEPSYTRRIAAADVAALASQIRSEPQP